MLQCSRKDQLGQRAEKKAGLELRSSNGDGPPAAESQRARQEAATLYALPCVSSFSVARISCHPFFNGVSSTVQSASAGEIEHGDLIDLLPTRDDENEG